MSAPRAKGVVVQQKPVQKKDGGARRVSQKKGTETKSKKLVLVEHSKDKNTKIQILNNVKQTKRELAPRAVVAITVPSPYRFPLPRTQSLALVARIAGLCFVVTGALLSYLALNTNQQILSVAETQRAETVTATQIEQQQAVTSPNGETAQVAALSISISLPSNTLRGIVPVTINAAAERVDVYAQGNSGSKVKLGSAKKTDTPSVWNFNWDTEKLNNGDYRLSVIAWVNGVAYEKAYETAISVQNAAQQTATVPVEAEENQITTSNTTEGGEPAVENEANTIATSTEEEVQPKTTEVEEEASTAVTLTASSGALRGVTPLYIKVAGAQSVRVSAYNTTTGLLYQAGIAQKVTDTEWKLFWNTANVVNGSYRLVASASIAGREYESSQIKVTIENEVYVKPQATTTTVVEELEVANEELEPAIVLSAPKQNPVSGYADIGIETESAVAIELYRQPAQSLSPSFLGQARRIDATHWVYTWNTKETPNGDYYLFANVKNAYGTTASSKTRVQVKNMILDTFTMDQAEEIDTLTKANTELVQPVDNSDLPSAGASSTAPKTLYIEPVDIFLTSVSTDEEMKAELADMLSGFRTQLDTAMNALGQALRKNDTAAIETARAAIEALKADIRTKIPEGPDREMILDRVSTYLDRTARELDALMVRNDTLLKERVGDAITNDSDKDGISDYDEIHLYQTNPFTADTDGDGFIDSVEITQGYDPHDSRSESLITYESPQDIGVVREDLLRIDSVSSLTFDNADETTKVQALFSGAGLPNSFVTLYIYSTPIIVTVKTDSDGNWNYMLDKDLEDGEHEIYVGMTDNAGRLIAKSSPLPFVKTAEAYTAGAIASANEGEGAPTFMGINTMIFASSFIVLVLGLVLLLIGTFAQPRIREEDRLIASAS